jgi:hypothetical protein
MKCRHCGLSLEHSFVDLGFAPPQTPTCRPRTCVTRRCTTRCALRFATSAGWYKPRVTPALRNYSAPTISPGGVFNNQDPAFVKQLTRLIPTGRMARVDEYRAAIQFLCSDASS